MTSEPIPVYVFSGTGNTRMAAAELKDQAAEIGTSMNIAEIGPDRKPPETPLPEVFGIMYPVYSFAAPRIIYQWIRSLPEGRGQNCFLILTAGGGENPINSGAANAAARRLKRKGYRVSYIRILSMPSNWLFHYPDDFSRDLMNVLPGKCADAVRGILAGDERRPARHPLLNALAAFIAVQEDHIGARFWGHMLKSGPECSGCGTCIRNCAMNNITAAPDGSGVRFGWSCQWCMRCVYECPQNAIVPRFLASTVLEGGFNPEKIRSTPKDGADVQRYARMTADRGTYLNDPSV